MNIIIFGNVPLTTWVIEQVIGKEYLNLFGVVCEQFEQGTFAHHGLKYSNSFDYCVANNIRILGFQEAHDLATKFQVLGLSVRYYRLFKKEYFSVFNPGILNFHGGELPRFRGLNIANHVILEGVSKCAGTIHFVDEGIDTGDIVYRIYNEVTVNDTAYDCFVKIQSCLQLAFKKLLNELDQTGSIRSRSQQKYLNDGENTKTYFKKDLDGKRMISLQELDSVEFDRKVRGFLFPGHEKAYIIFKDKKYYISI